VPELSAPPVDAECLTVWCTMGSWATLGASSWLAQKRHSKKLVGSATALSLVPETIPAAGLLGVFGLNVTLPIFMVAPI